MKPNLDYIIRDALNALEDESETKQVQIKSHIIYLGCCSYRHPNTETEKCHQYIDGILTNICKENKLVFCMGDQFDVNLSNYNIHNHTHDTDNIFSNKTVHEAIIGIIIP